MIYLICNSSFASKTDSEAQHDSMADSKGHTNSSGNGNNRSATGRGHTASSETSRPLCPRQSRKESDGNAKSAVTGTVHDFYAAAKGVDAAIANIRAQTAHAIRFLERETEARRQRIERYLTTIEENVEHLRPSDCEGGP